MGLFDRKASKIGLEGAHVLTDKGAAGLDIAGALEKFLPDYNLLGSYNLKLSGATNKFADLICGLMHKGPHSWIKFVRGLFS